MYACAGCTCAVYGHAMHAHAYVYAMHVGLQACTASSWELHTHAPHTHMHTYTYALQVAGLQADGLQCVSGGFDSQVKIWDLRQGLALRATMAAPPNAKCTRVAYDDTRVVTGSLTGSFVVFDMI